MFSIRWLSHENTPLFTLLFDLPGQSAVKRIFDCSGHSQYNENNQSHMREKLSSIIALLQA